MTMKRGLSAHIMDGDNNDNKNTLDKNEMSSSSRTIYNNRCTHQYYYVEVRFDF